MPSKQIPSSATVVIIGGGIVGCSVAYHLAKQGCSDVVLLERKSLTCGTTWHAAGLVGQLRSNHSLTQLAKYTADLYANLEHETGQATGYEQTGSYSLAVTPERFEELKRSASMARLFGVDVEVVKPVSIKDRFEGLYIDDVVGAVYLPGDGKTNPVDTTQALAKGARQHGVMIFENTAVTQIHQENDRVSGVTGDFGTIKADYVVNCGGMWARRLGQMCGVSVPLHAAEHYYVVTEPVPGLPGDLPVIRDPDNCIYIKEDAGKLLIGAFEPIAVPWGMDGIPETFCFDQLPDDFDHIEPYIINAMHRIPELEDTGLQLIFNGPESFTPDDNYYLGESPELKNFFIAAGFNSIGIQSAGGAGLMLAEWILNGHPSLDMAPVDIRRIHPFQNNASYLRERTVETLGLLYAMHWPYRQPETARDVRKSVLHEQLKHQGACFGVVAGWERANWYAPEGIEAEYEYSYGRQNWFDYSANEHHACRNNVVVFDQSSFSKFLVQGRDAETVLNYISANDLAVAVDRVVYTQWLNDRGGIEADLTVTRLAEDQFLVITGAATHTFVQYWLQRHIPDDAHVTVTDMSSAYSVLSIMGPQSRDLLASLCSTDVSHGFFPFATHQLLEIGYAPVHALRITYVGELGWELYIPTEFSSHVYEQILEHGNAPGLMHAGYHALNSLRMEKAYREWGHDIGSNDSPIEAGLEFVVDYDKPRGFLGRDALLRQKENGVGKRMVSLGLTGSEALLFHEEPIYRDGEVIGRTSSGAFSHTLNQSIALGYIEHPDVFTDDFIIDGKYEIEVANERFAAEISLKPLFDPGNEKIRR